MCDFIHSFIHLLNRHLLNMSTCFFLSGPLQVEQDWEVTTIEGLKVQWRRQDICKHTHTQV